MRNFKKRANKGTKNYNGYLQVKDMSNGGWGWGWGALRDERLNRECLYNVDIMIFPFEKQAIGRTIAGGWHGESAPPPINLKVEGCLGKDI